MKEKQKLLRIWLGKAGKKSGAEKIWRRRSRPAPCPKNLQPAISRTSTSTRRSHTTSSDWVDFHGFKEKPESGQNQIPARHQIIMRPTRSRGVPVSLSAGHPRVHRAASDGSINSAGMANFEYWMKYWNLKLTLIFLSTRSFFVQKLNSRTFSVNSRIFAMAFS